MPNFHRFYIPNSIVFITCITYGRYPYLLKEDDIQLFMTTVNAVQIIHPFTLPAYVILPDHFHWLIQLPEDQPDFSKVMQSVKWNYSLNYKRFHEISGKFNLWHRRFHDHVIRSEQDLEHHLGYIHWNPVKHGLAQSPEEWKYSSYKNWAEL